MSNFLQRTIFGILFVVIVVGSILISTYFFAVIIFAVNIIGLNEVYAIATGKDEQKSFRTLLVITGSLLFASVAVIALGLCNSNCWFISLALLFIPFLHALFDAKMKSDKIISTYFTGLLIVSLPSALMLFFFNTDYVGAAAGPYLMLTVFLMIWINDTFAYLFGIWLGRHRLFERISPKKSWEGTIGGLIFTLVAAYFWGYYGSLLPVPIMLGMALIVVLFCNLGDLVESMLKRQAGVKDSGTLIPGHGGVLDRFDAAFFVTPFLFIYLSMIYI